MERKKMEERLRVDRLVSEKNLGEALGVSKSTLYQFRQKGLPWLKLGGKVFYHESVFMEWILDNQKRVSDPEQNITGTE